MLLKCFNAALLGATLLAVPAMAQSNKAPPPAANQQTQTQMRGDVAATDLWRGSKVIGLNVYNNQNDKIGDINELLLDRQGRIEMVVIGVGGFLGMGEHNVAVKFSALKWATEPVQSKTSANRPATTTTGAGAGANAAADQNYPDHAVLDATKKQLKSMPEFKYNNNK